MALGRNKTGVLQEVVENLFWLAHVKEHLRLIGQYRKIGSRPRNFAWVNPFWNFKAQNFGKVATVTWMVGSSNFWYDRINIVFHPMDSDFQISRLVARESEMNDFWGNFVERHQVTGSIWFSQGIHTHCYFELSGDFEMLFSVGVFGFEWTYAI